jgi:hypothetical protein
MILNILKKCALPIALMLFSGSLFAGSDCGCCPAPAPEPVDPCAEEDIYPMLGDVPCAYNCPARIDVTGCWDMYLTASFIYWHANEENLELCTLENTSGPTAPVTNWTIIKPDFEYKPGFKVGAGTYFDHDDWGFYIEYTYFHMKNKNSESFEDPASPATAGLLDSSIIIPAAFLVSAPLELSFNWDLDMDIVDFELSRIFYNGKMLTLNPHFGFRLAFIDQSYDYSVVSTSRNTAGKAKSDSWAIGPRAGVNSAWNFGSNFRFLGNIAASLMYADFDLSQSQTGPVLGETDPDAVNNVKTDYHFLRANAEFAVGLAWGRYFSNHCYYFDLAALYEFHIFWDQNMMNYESTKVGVVATKGGSIGNLYLHGLTITARFDF